MEFKTEHAVPQQTKPIAQFPSLTGWASTLDSKIDEVFFCYLATDFLQSTHFMNSITSLPYTLSKYVNDPSACAIAIQQDLSKLFSAYFKDSEVICNPVPIPGKPQFMEIEIKIRVSDLNHDTRTSKSRIRFTSDQKLDQLLHFTNTGELKYGYDIRNRRKIYR